MRDLFTIVAVLIAAVLSAALAVPYFVDWQVYRDDVEAALGKAFGLPIHTEGAIALRFLPTPRLMLERVTVGPDAPFMTAEALNISLEAPPLLSGKIKVMQARLVRPVMRVGVNADGGLHMPALSSTRLAPINAAAIDNLIVEDGTIQVFSVEGGLDEKSIGPINILASTAALAGPWRIDGSVAGAGIHLVTGVPDAEHHMRVKLRTNAAIAPTDSVPTGEFDGIMQFGKVPLINGRLKITVPIPEWPQIHAEGEKAIPASMLATVNISTDGWRILGRELELRAGEGANAPVLTGEGAIDAGVLLEGERPRLGLTLSGRRVDLGSFLQSNDTTDRKLAHVLFERLTAGMSYLPIDLALNIGGIPYQGEEMGPVSLKLQTELDANGVQFEVSDFDLKLPGGKIQGRGTLTVNDNPRIKGAVHLAGSDMQRFANSLMTMGLPKQMVPVLQQANGATVTSNIEASRTEVLVSDLRVSTGESSINGEVRYSSTPHNQRARVEAHLVAHGFDLASLPTFDPASFVHPNTDLDIALEANSLRFGDLPATSNRRLQVQFKTSSEGIQIEQFDLADQDKAHLMASGRLDEGGGRIVASVNAQSSEALVALFHSFLPEEWRSTLTRSMPSIGPLALEATIARPGVGLPLVAFVKGTAAQTAIDAKLTHDPTGAVNDRAVFDLSLSHPDVTALLSQLGIVSEATRAKPPSALLTLSARGNSFDKLDGRGEVVFGENRLTLVGQWRDDENSRSLSGQMTFESSDITQLSTITQQPLLENLNEKTKITALWEWRDKSLNLKDLSGNIVGNTVSGAVSLADGKLMGDVTLETLDISNLLALSLGESGKTRPGQVWASERFVRTRQPWLPVSLSLKTKQLRATDSIGLENASLQLNLSPDAMGIQQITGNLAGGGSVQGDILLHRSGSQASFRANARFEKASPSALIGGQWSGALSGHFDVGASAENVAGLVANLAGVGELQLTQSAIPQFDPGALARIMPDLLRSEVINADIGTIASRLGSELDKNAWPLANVAIPLTIAGGVVRFGPLPLDTPDAKAGLNGTFDMNRLRLDARAHLTGKILPQDWSGTQPEAIIVWRGTQDAIERSIDAGNTANGLAAIALTRELDRIERMEAEARQRIDRARHERQERIKREQERLEQERQEAARIKAQAEMEAAENRVQKPEHLQTQSQNLPNPELPLPMPVPGAPLDIRPGAL